MADESSAVEATVWLSLGRATGSVTADGSRFMLRKSVTFTRVKVFFEIKIRVDNGCTHRI
jgi:hypothetical protein